MRRRFGGDPIVELIAPPPRIRRAAGADSYQLVVHLSGSASYKSGGQTIRQRAGNLVLLDPDAPFEASHPCGCQTQVWTLPRGTAPAVGRLRGTALLRRWLHGLLEDSGASFSRWVMERRLQECSRMLADRRYDHWSIAQIALSCGFNDLSTFYRHFRERHHFTPRMLGRQARGREFRDDPTVPATRRRMIAAASRAHSE